MPERARNFTPFLRLFRVLPIFLGFAALNGCSSSSPSMGTQPIAVSMANKVTTIAAGAAAVTLNASVQNDSTNSGVTWALAAGGVACSPGCGSLSASTATSVMYTPPATLPAAPNDTPTITATSVKDSSKSDAAPPVAGE